MLSLACMLLSPLVWLGSLLMFALIGMVITIVLSGPPTAGAPSRPPGLGYVLFWLALCYAHVGLHRITLRWTLKRLHPLVLELMRSNLKRDTREPPTSSLGHAILWAGAAVSALLPLGGDAKGVLFMAAAWAGMGRLAA